LSEAGRFAGRCGKDGLLGGKIALMSIIFLGFYVDTSSYSRSILVSEAGGGNGQRHNSVITSA
jgi:hypothetical protein